MVCWLWQGAVDGTHLHIKIPTLVAEDYFYFKRGGYSIQYQAVVDWSKKFLDAAIGMPGSTNDFRVLKCSSLYRQALFSNQLLDVAYTQEGFSPFFIGNKGYPLYLWLLTPYHDLPGRRQSIVERLYNCKLRQGRCMIENAFAILRQSFKELKHTTDLHVFLLPNVVVCYCLLHNLLLGQSPEQVANC